MSRIIAKKQKINNRIANNYHGLALINLLRSFVQEQ